MSLASQAILELEGKISDYLKAHEEAVLALRQKTDLDLEAAGQVSKQAILAYQDAKASELSGKIAQKEASSQRQLSDEAARLRNQLAQREPELIASILEEVQGRHGGI